jgi:selenocysteine lyase/cysteine desulfurase
MAERLSPLDRQRLARLRGEFPIVGERSYLFSGGLAPAPRRASLAIAAWLDLWSHDPATAWQRRFEATEIVRERLARILGVPPRTLALTDGTTRACNLAVELLRPEAGSNVVVDATTYPSCLYPWLPPIRPDVEIRRAPSSSANAGLAAGASGVAALMDGRTMAVVVSHVAPETGVRHDLRAMADSAHAGGAVLIADIAQSAGVLPLDLDADGVDLAAGTAMKWLLGPPGIGYLYVSEALLTRTAAPQAGYIGARLDPDGSDRLLLDPDARRHELGMPPLLTMPGFAAGLELIEEAGVSVIAAHVEELVERCLAGLARRGLRVTTPSDPALRAGLVVVPAREPSRVAAYLRDRGVDVWGSDRRGLIRIDPHLFDDGADIDRCLDALDAYAAQPEHQPLQAG